MSNTAQEVIETVRGELAHADRSRTPCDPVRLLLEPLRLDSAYAVQSLLIEERLDAGQRIVGHKVGLTSVSVQKQLGVDQPDYGVLTNAMEYGDQEEIPFSRTDEGSRTHGGKCGASDRFGEPTIANGAVQSA